MSTDQRRLPKWLTALLLVTALGVLIWRGWVEIARQGSQRTGPPPEAGR